MQWSKLKTRFRALLCDELRDRLDFHLTSYRESHDGAGEIWITLDGEKIFTCGHYTFEFAEHEGYSKRLTRDELRSSLSAREIFSPRDFGRSMKEYLDTPISEALLSNDPFKRAFAIIDRRIGRRTLKAMKVSETEQSLVKVFYRLRLRNQITLDSSKPGPNN